MTEANPSLSVYNKLQISHSRTLRCPCTTTTIPYGKFTSLSPVLHEVCSSDFIDDRWLSIVKDAADYVGLDWRNTAYSTFHLLSELCQQANNTIEDAVKQFLSRSFIVSSVMTEFDFNTQLNATLNQFFQSTITSFTLLVDTVGLLIQVDQPYLGTIALYERATRDKNLLVNIVTNETTNEQSFQVINAPDCIITFLDWICL